MYSRCVIATPSNLLSIALLLAAVSGVNAQKSIGLSQPRHSISVLDSTKEQDGLVGSVRRVKTESAKVELKEGRLIEGPLQLLELTTYSIKGPRIENESYPVTDSQGGKEEYKYDERGNITEMTLRDDQGAILSRESYAYEFDNVGNWTKMTTRLVVFESGKLKLEPVEQTYRTITYYFSDNLAKIVDSPPVTVAPSLPSTSLTPPNIEALGFDIHFKTQSIPSMDADVGDAPTPMTKPRQADPVVTRAESEPTAEKTSLASTGRTRLLNLKRAPVPAGNESSNEMSANATPARAETVVENKAVRANEVTEASPDNASVDATQTVALVLYAKGLEHFDKGEVQTAVSAFLASLKLAPSAEVYLNLGNAYLKIEKNNDAAKAFKESVKLNPEAAEAQYGLGLSLFRLKRFIEARNAFTKASTLEPQMAKAHYGLGLTLLELGQLDASNRVVRVLEHLDKELARKLAKASPELNYSCRFNMRCQ